MLHSFFFSCRHDSQDGREKHSWHQVGHLRDARLKTRCVCLLDIRSCFDSVALKSRLSSCLLLSFIGLVASSLVLLLAMSVKSCVAFKCVILISLKKRRRGCLWWQLEFSWKSGDVCSSPSVTFGILCQQVFSFYSSPLYLTCLCFLMLGIKPGTQGLHLQLFSPRRFPLALLTYTVSDTHPKQTTVYYWVKNGGSFSRKVCSG